MTRRRMVGDRVVYVAPVASISSATTESSATANTVMPGTVLAVSGVSALVLYDGLRWPLWGPQERMTLVVGGDGQLSLL